MNQMIALIIGAVIVLVMALAFFVIPHLSKGPAKFTSEDHE